MDQNVVMDVAGPSLAELNRKIDLLTAQIQFLTEQAQSRSGNARNARS